MRIKYLGHSAFLITTENKTRIITDPYAPDAHVTHGKITEPADVVTVSHGHRDHAGSGAVPGNPEVIKHTGTTVSANIEFHGIASFHDDVQGGERGSNTIFCFEADGIRVCHLGDLGHFLDESQLKEIGRVDVLMVPVGGNYTLDARGAQQVCRQLKPRVIIPMHYHTEKGLDDIAGVDDFIDGKPNVMQTNTSDIELSQGALPATTQTIVLKAAL
jgi:L-ascorbate metabolism protein UlaG (beta-lactamase superfamily)